MFKRSLSTFVVYTGVILVISTAAVFYILPKYKLSQINTPVSQALSPAPALTSAPVPAPTPTSVSSPASSPLTETGNNNSVHSSNSKALTLYEQGLKLYYQRQFPEALVLFNQALVIDPLCYEALNAKGATLAFQGNYEQGLALIQQALVLNPSFVYGHFNLGLANELAGRWDPAIAAYQKALQLDDQDTWSYYGIASIYGRLGKIDKVLEYLQPAINLDPDVKEVAREEKDFAPVRKDLRFQALVKP